MVTSVYLVLPLAPNDVNGSPVSRALVSQIWAIFVGVQLACIALLALVSRGIARAKPGYCGDITQSTMMLGKSMVATIVALTGIQLAEGCMSLLTGLCVSFKCVNGGLRLNSVCSCRTIELFSAIS
jgi:hypothetical protein